jgi:hypothetical protein
LREITTSTSEKIDTNVLAILESEEGVAQSDGFYQFSIDPIICADNETIFVRLKNAIIPHTFYNVGAQFNTITIIEDPSGSATQFSASVTAGNYTVSQLIESLKSEINDNASLYTYDMSFSRQTGKLTITADGEFTVLYDLSTIATRLGLTEDITSASGVATMQHIINLVPIRLIKVRMRDLSDGARESGNRGENVIDTILIDSNPLEVQSHTDDNAQRVSHRQKIISNISIGITDKDGRVIDFNGAEWSIVLNFSIQ